VREELGTHAVLGRERGEQLIARGLADEAVAVPVRRLEIALEDQRPRQREGARRHPDPHHHGTFAATEILGLGQRDTRAESPAEHRLRRHYGRQHIGIRLPTECRWVGGGFHTHLL